MSNLNTVVITGNLTRDPDLRQLTGGEEFVCKLRVGVSGRRKDASGGGWVDKPNYFDVAVWGGEAEEAAIRLARGKGVAITGRLDWHEWVDGKGSKRESVEIYAASVEVLDAGESDGEEVIV
jgi:single-strand DNA-binding protein